jgi:hypothetical protein
MVNPDEAIIAAEKANRYKPPVDPAKDEEPASVNPMGDYIGDYAAYLKEQRAENTKNKETNKYLALLQAGLGMMGGTSRYAGANIGQGASQGVAAYMAGRKQESADDRALQQGMLGLSRASLYDKMHSEDIKRRLAADKSREGFQKSQLGLKEQELGVNRQKVAALEKAAKAKNAATYGKLFKEFDDTADAAGIVIGCSMSTILFPEFLGLPLAVKCFQHIPQFARAIIVSKIMRPLCGRIYRINLSTSIRWACRLQIIVRTVFYQNLLLKRQSCQFKAVVQEHH